VDTVNSHALSFFAASLYIYLLLGMENRNWMLIGLSLGWLGLMRPQDLIFGIIALALLRITDLPTFATGVAVGFLPQLIAWQILYGKFWVSPYLSGGEYFDFRSPHILAVLFQPPFGLFTMAPIMLAGLIGLFWFKHDYDRKLKYYLLVVIILQIILVSAWNTWWQGASYGGRMFVSMLPVFSLGIAVMFKKLQNVRIINNIMIIDIASLGAINAITIIVFLLTHR
jgi:hypothetical protein